MLNQFSQLHLDTRIIRLIFTFYYILLLSNKVDSGLYYIKY